MRTTWKCWILLFSLGLGSCVPLPFNGIVTITPVPTQIQAYPTAVNPATSLPAEVQPVASQTPLPLPLPPTSTSAVTPQKITTETPPFAVTPASMVLQSIVEEARLDLVKRLSVSEADISLLQADKVSWADLSLGCPQPGMMYGQMVTPGYIVILQAGTTQYDYHAGPDRNPLYCSNPQPPIQVNPGEMP